MPNSHPISIELKTLPDAPYREAALWLVEQILAQAIFPTKKTLTLQYLPIDSALNQGMVHIPCNPELWLKPASALWKKLLEADNPLQTEWYLSDPLRFAFMVGSDELSTQSSPHSFLDTHRRTWIGENATKIAELVISDFRKRLLELLQLQQTQTKPSLLLSFDIDNLLVGWKGMLYRWWKKPANSRFNWRKEAETYQYSVSKILNKLEAYDLKAVFFLKAPIQKHKMDARDYLADISCQNLLNRIKNHPLIEVGLHSSYQALHTEGLLEQEHHRLCEFLEREPTIHRSHYLRYRNPESFEKLQQLGYMFDSSVAYSHISGSKSGFIHPYKLFNSHAHAGMNIQQIPLLFMDIGSQAIPNHEISYGVKTMEHQLDQIRKDGGVISWDFHHTTYDSLLHPLNASLFETALELISQNDIQTIHSYDL